MTTKVVVFGAGKYTERILEQIEKYFEIIAICDNAAIKWGNYFVNRYEIISPDAYMDELSQYELMISVENRNMYLDIRAQFCEKGIDVLHINEAIYNKCMELGEKFFVSETSIISESLIEEKRGNVFVLTAPSHSNLGDQAQTYCIENLIKKQLPDSNIYIFDELKIVKNYYELLYGIKQNLKSDDMIILHSGYRLTNLYMVSEHIVEMILNVFSDKKILFLPQTIHYSDDTVLSRISALMSDNIFIMCRDEISYKNSKKYFPLAKSCLFPDIVTSMIGRVEFNNSRNGILMCFRNTNDGESLFSLSEIDNLRNKLSGLSRVDIVDTTIDEDYLVIESNREFYIKREIKKYSTYKIVITNRFHGIIFSLIANTPVIVLPTKDHKLTSGIKWFKEADYKQVYYCNDMDVVAEKVDEIITNYNPCKNSSYFYDKYYKNLNLEDYFK